MRGLRVVVFSCLIGACSGDGSDDFSGDDLHIVSQLPIRLPCGTQASFQLEADGGKPPYLWSVNLATNSRIPPGVQLTSSGVLISAGATSVCSIYTTPQVTVKDSEGRSATGSLSVCTGGETSEPVVQADACGR